jgi:tRNA-dihydrouridine synthase
VKIRAGWDETHKNAIEIAKLVEDEGASLLTIHARTKVQGYSGKVDYAIVEQVCGKISIPVVGSGDIYDIEGVKSYFDLGVKGAMIGRAALKNPWIFKDIFCAICSKEENSGFNVPPEQIVSPRQSGLTGQSIVLKNHAEEEQDFASQEAKIKYEKVVNVLKDYGMLMRNNGLPENAVLGRLKQLVAQVTKGQVGGTKLRSALCQARTVEQFFEITCA